MIDEKKLIEDLKQQFPDWKSSSVGCIVKCTVNKLVKIIQAQPQIENCSNCSRRKFYQEGYADGLNANKWIPCSSELPKSNEWQTGEYEVTIKDGKKIYSSSAPFDYANKKWLISKGKEVVAWKSFSEPYKGDI